RIWRGGHRPSSFRGRVAWLWHRWLGPRRSRRSRSRAARPGAPDRSAASRGSGPRSRPLDTGRPASSLAPPEPVLGPWDLPSCFPTPSAGPQRRIPLDVIPDKIQNHLGHLFASRRGGGFELSEQILGHVQIQLLVALGGRHPSPPEWK